MLRNWSGIWVSVCVALALFAGAVLYAVHHQHKPRGFSGLEFAPLTPAAQARTPLLVRGGALVLEVTPDSPASRVDIKPGEVLSAIDGAAVQSARQASDIIRSHGEKDRVTLTLYDITKGDIHPRDVALVFDAAPPVTKHFSVRPPRTLAKEFFPLPNMAANAAWSKRIARGPTIRPLLLTGLGAGDCNAFAPEEWRVAAHAPDNSLFHVMAKESFAHAIFKSAALNGVRPESFIIRFLHDTFGSPAVLTPQENLPFGFVWRDFGNSKGGAGFVEYRVTGNRIALWVAGVPGGDVAWAKPLVGAVALSMRCAAPGAPKLLPRDAALVDTAISTRCIDGQCAEGDFAATSMATLRFGYVHNRKGEMFLVRPRRDFWQNGAEGPGFYHQIGGENEKLEPGRIN
jgi:hypothetical protein